MRDTTAEKFIHTVPSSQQRILIDMVNTIDVAEDHLRALRQDSGSLTGRLFGALKGTTQRRNSLVAQNHHVVLQSVVETIKNLAENQTRGNHALTKVARRLTEVEESLASVANVLVETRQTLRQLRNTVDENVDRIRGEIARMDLRAAATEQMDHVISRWEAGEFDAFPLGSRCYVALHELYWGEFGEYLRLHAEANNIGTLLGTLQNRLAARLKDGAAGEDALPLSVWLAPALVHEESADFFIEGLAYLGSNVSADGKPWSYTLTQLPEPGGAPTEVARFCAPAVLSHRVTREFFPSAARLAHG